MTKYTRSINKVSSCIQDIFRTSDISLDTKAILLVLSATMSNNKFKRFLAPLSVLSPIYAPLMEINSIRVAYGSAFRDYIILNALKSVKHDVNSDELQQIIRDANSTKVDPAHNIAPALNAELVMLNVDAGLKHNHAEFHNNKQSIIDFLLENLTTERKNDLLVLIDAYLKTRTNTSPQTAYAALIAAIAEILHTSGFDEKYAEMYSKKITQHVLKEFLQSAQQKQEILHAYNSNEIRAGW